MVQYYTSNVVTPSYSIFMGDDKFENEDLIRWTWPEDVWFHVDKLSSAHVYLRLHGGETLDDIPKLVLEDCAQLVKANSIQGNKQNNLDIVYTLSANLKKTADMEVGQVCFHKQKEVRTYHIEKRLNEIVNRLNKTKIDRKTDLKMEREERDAKESQLRKEKILAEKKREKDEKDNKKKEVEIRSYSSLMKSENMSSNQEAAYDSDDFM